MVQYSGGAVRVGSRVHQNMRLLFERSGRVKKYAKNEIIYRQGDAADKFCYIKSGRVRVYMNSLGGSEKTLNTAGGGEIIGEGAFFDKKPRVSSAAAVTDCEVILIGKSRLSDIIAETPGLAFELLEILANRIRLLSYQLDSMTFMQADARVAAFLLENNRGGRVNVTHTQLASAVGVSRVTVSKTLESFARSGIVTTAYRSVKIRKAEELEKILGNTR